MSNVVKAGIGFGILVLAAAVVGIVKVFGTTSDDAVLEPSPSVPPPPVDPTASTGA